MHTREFPRHFRNSIWVTLEMLGLGLLAVCLSWNLLKAISNANVRANDQLRAEVRQIIGR